MNILNSLRHVISTLGALLGLYKCRTCHDVGSLLNIKKTTTAGHGGWPHTTVMAHNGCMVVACRLSGPTTAVSNRRLQPPWAMVVGPSTAVAHGGATTSGG
jgi:hypothetical protein